MDVTPGELVHMDENGALNFPSDKLADSCNNIDAFVAREDRRAEGLLAAKTLAEIKTAWTKENLPG